MKPLPEVLAARAVHQYRRRDIFAYVSLRQYLRNSAALRDIWSDEIAAEQVADRRRSYYNEISSFKEIDARTGRPGFRALHIPGPNEILAETALLAACAEAGGPFDNHASVFSYLLCKKATDTAGAFQPYFEGFKARHAGIAVACRAQPEAVVIYTDIRKYYPSITLERALAAWRRACADSALAPKFVALGEKLLADARDHQNQDQPDHCLLTGPMFSHLIGNLIFRDIDTDLSAQLPGGYFRYVDDVAIVAPKAQALAIENRLRDHLARLGLELNEDKRLAVPASAWLRGEKDFEDHPGTSWKTFIGDMRRLLLFYPEERQMLETCFSLVGIRIRPIDYSEAAQERGFLDRLNSLIRLKWFRRSVRAKNWAGVVVNQAVSLRKRYASELEILLSSFESLRGYERKRRLYRLKFLVARMAYLAPSRDLPGISAAISGIPEMAMAAAAYDAISSRNVTQLLKYGPTAAQSAAQPLRAGGETISCGEVDWTTDEVVQAYAVFRLNGLEIEGVPVAPLHPLVRFSDWNDGSFSLYHERDGYFREIGCIHGMDDFDANRWAVETAFDRDDGMVFDMQEIMQASS